MTTLTLAMIVRDEEMTMDRVLTCASGFCDEIVVVDTGSTDQTIPIIQAFAQRHPNIRVKIDHFEWINDFSAARNYAFSLSTSVWTMWLDADDILHADAIEKIKALKAEALGNPDLEAVFCGYTRRFDPASGKPTKIQNRGRFYRTDRQYKWSGPVHEYVELTPTTNKLLRGDIQVIHDPLKPKSENRYLEIIRAACPADLDAVDPKTIKTYADVRYAFYMGQESQRLGQLEEALRYFTFCVNNDAQFSHKYNMLRDAAEVLIRLNRPDEALTMAVRAIEFDSSRAEAYTLAGRLCMIKRQPYHAIPFYRAALACRIPAHADVFPLEYDLVPYRSLTKAYGHTRQYGACLWSVVQSLRYKASLPQIWLDLKPALYTMRHGSTHHVHSPKQTSLKPSRFAFVDRLLHGVWHGVRQSVRQGVVKGLMWLPGTSSRQWLQPLQRLQLNEWLAAVHGQPHRFAPPGPMYDPEKAGQHRTDLKTNGGS